MKEKLIEKLNAEILHIFESGANEIRVLNMVEAFINKYYEYEALTSVKSEDEQSILSKTELKNVINKQARKHEDINLNSDFHSFIEGAIWMHDFSNKSEAMKQGEITFGNHLKAYFKIVDNKIEILDAVNGWGNNVPKEEIKVEYLTNKEK